MARLALTVPTKGLCPQIEAQVPAWRAVHLPPAVMLRKRLVEADNDPLHSCRAFEIAGLHTSCMHAGR